LGRNLDADGIVSYPTLTTETIVHLYEERVSAASSSSRAMFAFALLDTTT